MPDTPANGYQQVMRPKVADNIIVNCKVPVTVGVTDNKKCTLPPSDISFTGNTIFAPKRPAITLTTSAPGWKAEGNTLMTKELGAQLLGLALSPPSQSPPESPLKPLREGQTGPAWLR